MSPGVRDCCEVRMDVPERQRRVLRAVLWLNAVMFVVELSAGVRAHSTSLVADSVDMLGDALVYGAASTRWGAACSGRRAWPC